MSWFKSGFDAMPPWLRATVLIVGVAAAVATGVGAVGLAGSIGWNLIGICSLVGPVYPIVGGMPFLLGLAGLTAASLAVLSAKLTSVVKAHFVAHPAHLAAAMAPAILVASALAPIGNQPAASEAPTTSSPTTITETPAQVVAPVSAAPARVAPTSAAPVQPVAKLATASAPSSDSPELQARTAPAPFATAPATRTEGIVGSLQSLGISSSD